MSPSASSPTKMLGKQKHQPSTTRKNCCPCPGKSSEKELIPNFKSTEEFYRYLEKSKPTQLMVINFTTEWCGPCKKAKDPFEKLPDDYGDVKFAKVDVDALMNIAEELDVTMMPTFLLVKVKKLEKEHVKKDGMQGEHKGKTEPPEKEHVTKDGVQGDHKEKKEPPEKERVKILIKSYKMVELARVVGWNKETEEKLRKKIGTHR
ncbi:thioredoxin H2-like protein [Cinnamomum micranthum f. kanehirae]|uniref:Thioredoxin H2-like protein n=1 Tax=Cinnamomum micranthum f. kanehirae TaxID=337451 RepID=A0A3S3M5W5_9MAGN|nr:thioredoxin H2-like protein [Cinnamomum micranthum f. kanehirae]